MKLAVFAFTRQGCQTARKAAGAMEAGQCRMFAPDKFEQTAFEPYQPPLADFVGKQFSWADAILFVGSTGMAVRGIAPWVRDKKADPAVLVTDEQGKFVISLLSGHIGGANRLTLALAEALGAVPVITTATDVNRKFSVDAWAAQRGLTIGSMEAAKAVSAAILEGDVPLVCDYPIGSPLPGGVIPGSRGPVGIYIGWRDFSPFDITLRLIPKVLNLGIGCRRGIPEEKIAAAVEQALGPIPMEAVAKVVSIDLKQDETGLLAFCAKRKLPAVFYSAEELNRVTGHFPASERVKKVTGVDNVCQRAAMVDGKKCILEKRAMDGVTVALAEIEWEAVF